MLARGGGRVGGKESNEVISSSPPTTEDATLPSFSESYSLQLDLCEGGRGGGGRDLEEGTLDGGSRAGEEGGRGVEEGAEEGGAGEGAA